MSVCERLRTLIKHVSKAGWFALKIAHTHVQHLILFNRQCELIQNTLQLLIFQNIRCNTNLGYWYLDTCNVMGIYILIASLIVLHSI